MEVLLEPAGGPTSYMSAANADGAFSFSDQRGQFVFWDVAPGGYRAFLVSGYDEGLWENRDFTRSVADLGTVTVVPEDGSGALSLKLGPTLLSPVEVERAASRVGN